MKQLLLCIAILSLFSCAKESKQSQDDFKRELVLDNWVNNLIIPAFTDFKSKMDVLKTTSDAFVQNPNETSLQEVQTAMFNAQKVWQHVAMFELQSDNGTRVYMNTYPVDRETSTSPILNSNEDDATLQGNLEKTVTEINKIDFEKNSGTIDEQGFPALDYLINHPDALNNFTNQETSESYKAYLNKVITRMVALTNTAQQYWTANAASIIANKGSNANASFDKMLNDYVNYIEQGFRENKIARPSGKRDGIKNKMAVEAYYSAQNSKLYFNEAFKAIQNFYYGTSYDGTQTKEGISDYLDHVKAQVYISSQNKDVDITAYIKTSFSAIENAVDDLNDNFAVQVENDNTKVLALFNIIQDDLVTLIKTNVFQELNVQVDYKDSDGD